MQVKVKVVIADDQGYVLDEYFVFKDMGIPEPTGPIRLSNEITEVISKKFETKVE